MAPAPRIGLVGLETGPHPQAGWTRLAAALNATGHWDPVPLTEPREHGPAPRGRMFPAEFESRLGTAGPLQAAVVIATDDVDIGLDGDPDGLGRLLRLLREAIPRPAPVLLIAGSSVHPSPAALGALDGLFTPALAADCDLGMVAEQAGFVLRLVLAGEAVPRLDAVRVPLLWPRTVALGAKWAAVVADLQAAARRAKPDLLAIALLGGRPQAAPELAGVTVAVTERRPSATGIGLARSLAARLWEQRGATAIPPMTLSQAVALARNGTGGARLVLVDAGDRIDQGGSGEGVELLAALAWNGARSVLALGHVDADLVSRAMRIGAGADLSAIFRGPPGGGPFETEARVLAVSGQGPAGASAALQFGDVTVVVSGDAGTALEADPARLGITVDTFATLVTKAGPEACPALRDRGDTDWHDVWTPGPTSPAPHPSWEGRTDAPYPVDLQRSFADAGTEGGA